jgi:hypothetical protein
LKHSVFCCKRCPRLRQRFLFYLFMHNLKQKRSAVQEASDISEHVKPLALSNFKHGQATDFNEYWLSFQRRCECPVISLRLPSGAEDLEQGWRSNP